MVKVAARYCMFPAALWEKKWCSRQNANLKTFGRQKQKFARVWMFHNSSQVFKTFFQRVLEEKQSSFNVFRRQNHYKMDLPWNRSPLFTSQQQICHVWLKNHKQDKIMFGKLGYFESLWAYVVDLWTLNQVPPCRSDRSIQASAQRQRRQ